MRIIETTSREETLAAGRALGEKARPGDIYCLCGDLGAGKTVFAKGVALGLGIGEHVNSPTFTILQIYEGGRLPLYHFDVYRIEDEEEMEEVGLDEYLFGEGVCLIEWPERIADILPDKARIISIERDPARGTDWRRIVIEEDE